MQGLCCGDGLPSVARGPLVVSQGFQRACAGSVVVVCGLSCPIACGILAPQPGIKALSPALQGRFLTIEASGRSQGVQLLYLRRSIS